MEIKLRSFLGRLIETVALYREDPLGYEVMEMLGDLQTEAIDWLEANPHTEVKP